MSWVKVDDQFAEHPKFLALGEDRLAATGLWLVGLAYANRYLTDGMIPTGALPSDAGRLAGRLVKAHLWDAVAGGYRIHDYLEFQPPRVDMLALRAARAAAGRKGGLASGERRRSGAANEATGEALARAALEPPSTTRPVPVRLATTTTTPIRAVVVYSSLYGKAPSGSKLAWLVSLDERFGADRTVHALEGEYAKDPDPSTICGRMQAGLLAGDRKAGTGGAA